MTAANGLYKKYFPENFTLETPRVILRPLQQNDLEAFLPLTRSAETFTYFVKDLSVEEELRAWVDNSMQERANGIKMPFTIIDKDTKQICGSTSYGNISFDDLRIEVGWSWLAPAYVGVGVNKQVKFALFSYAFGVMRMERVEAKTDVLNERAKAALLKVGMIPEGILRSHMQMHSGRRRDTIYFSLLREEWRERMHSFFPELV